MKSLKIKLPTWKELNMNLRAILINKNMPTFSEFRDKYGKEFCKKLGAWLIKNNQHSAKNFREAWELLFYYGYINNRRERNLLDFLRSIGVLADWSSIYMDACHGVDIIARNKQNTTHYIQVKPYYSTSWDFKNIVKVSDNANAVPVLAVPNKGQWDFYNIKNLNELIKI